MSGIDALPGKGNGLELVLDSVLDATFIYPTNGDKVLQLAMDILEEETLSQRNGDEYRCCGPYQRTRHAVADHTHFRTR